MGLIVGFGKAGEVDEAGRAFQLGHDAVAGICAKAAADAAQLQSVADVNAGRADIDAQIAVHAVADIGASRLLLCAAARLAAPGVIGHDLGVGVEHGRLETWPGAHVEADFFACETGQKVGQCGEHSDHHDRWRGSLECRHLSEGVDGAGEVANQGQPGQQADGEPCAVLADFADKVLCGQALFGAA
jgi:hypothetical protein